MASWLNPLSYVPQAVVDLVWAPRVEPPPTTYTWCEGIHIVRMHEIEGYIAIYPLFPPVSLGMKVKEISDDGNCLYRAFADYGGFDYEAMRKEVAAYLQEHAEDDEFIKGQLLLSIDEYNERTHRQQKEQALNIRGIFEAGFIDDEQFTQQLQALEEESQTRQISSSAEYLKRVAQDQFFGGALEIYALARIYFCPVGVYTENRLVFLCVPENSEDKPRCFFRFDAARAHYDLMYEPVN